MALRKLYCKHFLSKTYPAIIASRRQKHQSEKDEEKNEEEVESVKKIGMYERNKKEGITPEQMHFLNQDIDLSWSAIKRYAARTTFEASRKDQMFNQDRIDTLGPEIGPAHFIIARNGAVKFKDRKNWIRVDASGSFAVPRHKVDCLYLEGIDASNTELMYEGLDNLKDIQELKFLNLSNCKYIDDFCMSRLQMFKNSLEVLDVSGCELVTEMGIACLHHLPNLKVLNIANTPNIKYKEVLTFYIEEMLPNCVVHGVDHNAIIQEDTSSLEEHGELLGQLNTRQIIEEIIHQDKTVKELYMEAIKEEKRDCLEEGHNINSHQLKIDQKEKIASRTLTPSDHL